MIECPSCHRLAPDDALRCAACETDLPTRSVHHAAPAWLTEMPRFEPGQLFDGRFKIIEQVAEGGMGIVYKAIDTEIGGEVALKLLPPALAAHEDYIARFRREVRVTRDINHQNVCRVFDHGTYRSIPYFFMEWVRGETLRDLLNHSRRVETDRALEIAQKVAEALHTAHAHGVIHRDIKPGNIMIDEHGEVRVMDFGVATELKSELTGSRVFGTPEYMSPEQRAGRKIDARSDLYSLGLVLQEMLTGDPFGTAQGMAADIVLHLRAEDPARRYPDAAMAAAAIAQLRARLKTRSQPRLVSSARVRWAVLGAAAIIVLVGLVPWPPPAIKLYRKAEAMLRQAETTHALDDAIHTFYRSTVLDSSFAPSWAGMGEAYWMRYDRTKEKLSRDEAENDVRRALRIDPKLAEARLAEAHGLLTVGKADSAKTILLQLVQDESKMSQAWALLGRAYQASGDKEKGLAALQRAVALDPNNWRPYVQLGQYYKRIQDYAEAEHEFREAVVRKQTSPTAWMNLGGVLLLQDKTLEALTALETGTKYDPTPGTYSNLGSTYYYTQDYAKAADRYRQAAELDPLNPIYPGNLGDACRMLGEKEEADSAYREAARLAGAVLATAPDDLPVRLQLALARARLGEADSASVEASRVLAKDPKNVDALFALAVNSAVQGQDDAAADDLEKAVRLGLGKAQIVNDPDLTRLKGQPRFEKVLKLAS